jgi:hypothetical protein
MSLFNSESLEKVKREKKIGLVIHANSSIFASGILQNAYFLMLCFEHMGMKCEFLCHEENPAPFDYKKIPMKQLSTNPLFFDPSEYHTIITVSRGISAEFAEMCRQHKVALVSFICGNTIMHDQEDFVRGTRGGVSTFIGKGASHVDELWVIPEYKHSLSYIETVRNKPAYIVPHVWDPCILYTNALEKYHKTEKLLQYDITRHHGKQIEIFIMEPNISLFKNCWIPLVACDKLHKNHPELIEQVFAFNFPDNSHANNMADNLGLGSKVRRFKRLSMPNILSYCTGRNSIPIFLSYQVNNSLNYIYYELLRCGYPLVHNSPDLDGCGYYYPEFDIDACIAQIIHAYKYHNHNIETYLEKGKEYLKRVDPYDKDVCTLMSQMVNKAIVNANTRT